MWGGLIDALDCFRECSRSCCSPTRGPIDMELQVDPGTRVRRLLLILCLSAGVDADTAADKEQTEGGCNVKVSGPSRFIQEDKG